MARFWFAGERTPQSGSLVEVVKAGFAERLDGVSAHSSRTVVGAARGVPNNQVGVSRLVTFARRGGTVRPDPTLNYPGTTL